MKSLKNTMCTIIMMAFMVGCGGGGSNVSGVSGVTGGNGTTLTVSGVAANGAPLIGTVILKDSSTPTNQLSTSTAADGFFSFDVSNLTAPFLLQSSGTSGGHFYTRYSMALQAGNCSINPLTHLAVTMANAGIELSGIFLFPSPAKLQALSAQLQTAVTTTQNKLAPLFTKVSAFPTNIITDQYSANSQGLDLLFDLAEFTVGNGNLSITPKLSGGIILPSTSIKNGEINGSLNIDTVLVYTVSGTITTTSGAGLTGVTVKAAGTGSGTMFPTVKSDSNGNFKLFLPPGGYTINASLNGHVFTPDSIAATVGTADITGKNFVDASSGTGSTVSGNIMTANRVGIPGATVSLAGASTRTTTTDSTGNYSFTDVANGSYTLSATLNGYTFNTPPMTININNASITGKDFSADPIPPTYLISGAITFNGTGLPGISVALTNSGYTSFTTTDSGGNYLFSGRQNGSYVITPSLSGYSFSPGSKLLTVNGANVTVQDFTATNTGSITANW